jgi:tetratricopeptide (TPR) repeat protein
MYSRSLPMKVGAASILAILLVIPWGTGCESLDGRNRVRKGNRDFKDSDFVSAVGEYEKALTEVDDPIIHYNLGLALQKLLKPGSDKPVNLDQKDSLTCQVTPKTTSLKMSACIKEGDKHFAECDAKNVCPASFSCQPVELCQLPPEVLADMITANFQVWLTKTPDDAETRALMTQVWLDTSQYKKATDYWESLLKSKPNDPDIMGALAGISLKAGDWRKSIEWYLKVADATKDESAKINAYQFIGNVGWAKLNSKTLPPAEGIELADRAIGALQKAAALSPQNPKFVGLQASIFNFRSMIQGSSWASAIERASAQDLQHRSRVLSDEAKKAQGQTPTPTPTPSPGSGSATPKTGG